MGVNDSNTFGIREHRFAERYVHRTEIHYINCAKRGESVLFIKYLRHCMKRHGMIAHNTYIHIGCGIGVTAHLRAEKENLIRFRGKMFSYKRDDQWYDFPRFHFFIIANAMAGDECPSPLFLRRKKYNDILPRETQLAQKSKECAFGNITGVLRHHRPFLRGGAIENKMASAHMVEQETIMLQESD